MDEAPSTGGSRNTNDFAMRALYYILVIKKRLKNKRTILGRMYTDKTYKMKTMIPKANITSFV